MSRDTCPTSNTDVAPSLGGHLRSLPSTCWLAFIICALERVAYYQVRVLAPLYLYSSTGDGGLGVTEDDKAILYGLWAAVALGTPVLSSVWADARGYRRALLWGAALGAVGYVLLALSLPVATAVGHAGSSTAGCWMFGGGLVLAGAGTGVLQPVCVATVARTAGAAMPVGWGAYYFALNVAGACGPILGGAVRSHVGFVGAAYLAAIFVVGIGVLVALSYRDPVEPRPVPMRLFKVCIRTGRELVTDSRYLVPIVCVTVVSTVAAYLGDLAYAVDWIEPGAISRWPSALFSLAGAPPGDVRSLYVLYTPGILLAVPIAYWVGRTDRLKGATLGAAVATANVVLMVFTRTEAMLAVVLLVSGITPVLIFATMESYIACRAPRAHKASYMAYYYLLAHGIIWVLNVPLGWAGARMAPSRAALAREALGASTEVPEREALARLAEQLATSEKEAARVLWQQHDPWTFWVLLSVVALTGLAGLAWYSRTAAHRGDS